MDEKLNGPRVEVTPKQQDQLDFAKSKLSKWASRLFDPNRLRGLVEAPKVDHNPYGGCVPGVSCPWYPSKVGEPHCESSANFAGIYGLRGSAELCCRQHFGHVDSSACVENSYADVAAEKAKVVQDLARPKFYYPDMMGKMNCVFDSNYEDWMMGPNKELYLFDNDVQCCGNCYPNRSSSWYPSLGADCPLAGDDGVQEGEFWVVDEAFFPNWKGDGCGYGNDWPEWMADPTQAESHLFATAEGCCDFWFPAESAGCQDAIVYSSLGKQIGGPVEYGTWYPSLNGRYECIDGDPPAWMKAEGYMDEYVFDSHAECCQAHYCTDIRGDVQSGNFLEGPVRPGHYPRP